MPSCCCRPATRRPGTRAPTRRSSGFIDAPESDEPWTAFVRTLFGNRFTLDLHDKDAVIAAFEAHYAAVRATVPVDRLVEWTVADGWEPLCAALGVEVPDDPFPRLNTREEWAAKDETSRSGAHSSRSA